DKGRRLVLTNYHVVGNVKDATVFFPAFDGKKVVPERRYYLDRARALGIPGEVVEVDKAADLALVRIDRVPEGAAELPLAADSPDPGQTVHSVGNPGRSGALWVYTPGKVRQVYAKKWRAKLDDRHVHEFEARVVETDSPTNPGDSGGPLVDDAGRLVGVTEGGAIDAQSLSTFVDLSEVKRLLRRRSVMALRDADDKPAAKEKEPPGKAAREKPLPSTDGAKLFGEEAWKKVGPAAERLLKERKTDLVVETVETPPKDDIEKVRGMSGAERERYFGKLVVERAKADKLAGVYLFVCKTPPFLYVEVTEGFGGPDDARKRLADDLRKTLLAAFRDKKFDEGLMKAINMVLEAKGLGEKK
ncbi:MAG: trypsin-like peptidase domain-containing protein, partial [Gemmataceae bacterium]|nr:trypsin-like peptidase domain-containing protein [Gemmataceae bacterium]